MHPVQPSKRPVDVNQYATKKTVAQGMMDLALLTANANQLRYVLELQDHSTYFYVNLVLIIISIVLQVLVLLMLQLGLGLDNLMPAKCYPLKHKTKHAILFKMIGPIFHYHSPTNNVLG